MTIAKRGWPLACILLMFLHAGVFAQDSERRVAIVPFWGDDEYAVSRFSRAFYEGLAGMDGFRPTWVDSAAITPDLNFPPFLPPSPVLTADAPLAVTGDVFVDPSSGVWRLQLYLWQTSPLRLLFSDGMLAFDWDIVGMIMPITLGDLFGWAEEAPPETIIVEVEVPVEVIVEVPVEVIVEVPGQAPIIVGGQQVVVYQGARQARQNVFYAGARLGGNLRLLAPLGQNQLNMADIETQWANLDMAAHFNWRFLRFMGIQIECVFNLDMQGGSGDTSFSLAFPVLLRMTFLNQGNASFSLLGGAYFFLPLGGNGQFDHNDDFRWGYTAGLRIGGRVGANSNLFVDMRWSHDMFSSKAIDYFRRSSVSVGVGVEFGFRER